jgi:hypothetical protein
MSEIYYRSNQGGNSGLQDFKTSKDFTRLQYLGLQIFKRLQKISKEFKGLQQTSKDFKGLQATLRDFMRLQGTLRDFMRRHIQGKTSGFQDFKTSKDLMRLQGTSETS